MDNNKIYEEAENIIRNRRKRASREQEERKKEVENRIPEVRELNKQFEGLSMRLLAIMKNGVDIEEKIHQEERHTKQAKRMLESYLVQYGYDEDYLDFKYTCEICSDTGSHNGKRCKCFKEILKNLSIKNLNISTQLKLSSFETFDVSYYGNFASSMKSVYDYCIKYAKDFSPKISKSLFMYGETGLGKTHLSLSIANVVIEKGYSVAYDSVINYLRKIENEQFGRGEDGVDTLETILDADLLILDDLGAEYQSKFHNPNIYNIINTRLNRSLPTIISTNLTHTEIEERYDTRITSRIGNIYESLKFVGTDIRFLKRNI